MAKQRHLRNAPITEAIIDIRVKLPDSFEVTQFVPIKDKIKNKYPILDQQHAYQARQEFKKGKPVHFPFEDLGVKGYFFKTDDKIKIVQFRLDGFTFNHLKPYTCWKDVFEEAMGLWKLFKDTASPELITRLAVRYINHISLPLPNINLNDYLTVPPVVPEGLPQAVLSFLNKTVIMDSNNNRITANITQASDDKWSDKENLSVILDIDAYKHVNFGPEKEGICDIFESLRQMKNNIFFEYLTEKAVEIFE